MNRCFLLIVSHNGVDVFESTHYGKDLIWAKTMLIVEFKNKRNYTPKLKKIPIQDFKLEFIEV